MQFKVSDIIGGGASGYIFRATEIGGTSKTVAVKKSRAPARIKRPTLQHEGRLPQMLQGHASIPALFGYGRFEHFEYLGMELLEVSLDKLYTASQPISVQTALLVTEQMLSALLHVHSHNIVHRDVKPGNIMVSLEDTYRLKLIDFGISRHFRTGTPKRVNLYSERAHLVGSVYYASLNAHEGIEISRRDDLESLFYSVLCLLRGSLPWSEAVDGRFGIYTKLGMMRHVHMTKKAWSGSMLGAGCPGEFGQLLDQVRGLAFDAEPDYPGYFRTLESLRSRLGLVREEKLNWPVNLTANPAARVRRTPPVSCAVLVGQLVNVQILLGPSTQGYGAHGDDPAVWKNPIYDSEEWKAPARPAIVVKVELSFENRHHRITVLPLSKFIPLDAPSVSLDAIAGQQPSLHTGARWPDTLGAYCYYFGHPCVLVAVETEPVSCHWSLSPEQVEILQRDLLSGKHDLNDHDTNANERLKRGPFYYVYARLTPLLPGSLNQTTDGRIVEWESKRGWFDELVKISIIRRLEGGWACGEAAPNMEGNNDDSYEEYTSSYVGVEVDPWDNMGAPRGRSVTLPHEEEERLDIDIPEITGIVGY